MRGTLAALAVLAAVGCSDSTGPSGQSAVGTYTLVAIDGDPLPYEFFGSEIRSGSLVLRADKTFTATTTDDVSTESESGTYAHSGSTITFTTSEGSVNGTYNGTTIEIDATIVVLTYRR